MVIHSNTPFLDYDFNILNSPLHYVSTSSLCFLKRIGFPINAELFPVDFNLSTFESIIRENVSRYFFFIFFYLHVQSFDIFPFL